jgi:hypothetical protein
VLSFHAVNTSRNIDQSKSGESILPLNSGYFIFPAKISNITVKQALSTGPTE